MEDTEIIALYFARSEEAIAQTERKYGALCRKIAGNILRNDADCDECVQDTYYRAWETIPPTLPHSLRGYLACVVRSISLTRWRREHAGKRGGSAVMLSLDELGDCVPVSGGATVAETLTLTDALNRFLAGLRDVDRRIFLQRYWYFCSIAETAKDLGVGQSRVKVSLYRSREKLRLLLEEEGIAL